MIAYTNGIIYTGHSTETQKAVLVKNKIVVDVVPNQNIPSHAIVKDLQGRKIAPAFIDLQIYGGNGTLFSEYLSETTIENTYKYCLSGGATKFLITLATNSTDVFLKGIDVVKNYCRNNGKGLLGIHLEGPYLNPEKRGAHIKKYIKKPTLNEVKNLLDVAEGVIKMMTLAPECCEEAIIELLIKNDVVVSAGHSNATYQLATKAFDKNILVATHLFNAMSPLHHREPGIVMAICNHSAVKASIVCDGIHVNYAAVLMAKRLMGERLFYITDAVAESTKGSYQHIFKGDHYCLPDGTISGSALTMMKCVENGVKQVGISLEESLRMASLYPAAVIKQANKLGKIEAGYDANFVVFDDEYTIHEIIFN